jgi:hypothetical protein
MEKTFRQYMDYDDVVRNEPAMCLKEDGQMVNGRLVLTKKRVLFGTELNARPDYAIDLDTINTLRQETYIVDNHILCIHYLQYERARFSVSDYDSWEKAIEEQRILLHPGSL